MEKAQWRVRPGFIPGLVLSFIIIYLLFKPYNYVSRGNGLALLGTRIVLKHLKSGTIDNRSVDFYALPHDTQQKILNWSFALHILLKTNFVWATDTNRQIITVCEREYDNVPKPTLWNFHHKNPAHAVGYSDGTTGLISPMEYTNLNLSMFSTAIQDTNSELKLSEK